MAYNYFQPLKYEPFSYTGATAPEGAFQGYAGNQFQSLFDAINKFGKNPAITGETFSGAPKYSPYKGGKDAFSTPSYEAYTMSDDGAYDNLQTFPGSFDQQGYMDARFGNISDYLGKLGSYFGNMGSPTGQQILANAPSQGPRPPMPTIGSNLNLGGSTGGTNINNPFPSFGIGANAGWGTPPTSLFGAGANATNT